MKNQFIKVSAIMLTVTAAVLIMSFKDKTDNPSFAIFDAICYPGKPDLTSEGLLPVNLRYEASLTKPDPNDPSKVILDMDKIKAMAEIAAVFPKVIVSTDIEHWYADRKVSGEEMKADFMTMFDVFREKNAEVYISNYGVPYSALNLRRWRRETVPEEEILREWKASSAKRVATHEAMDYFCPSVYIGVPGVESWAKDLETTVNEIKALNASKKIYVYIWPQYYDRAGSPYFKKFIDPADWTKMLEAAYQYCDGVIIWSSRTDENGQVVTWNDPKVQAIWNATKEFMVSHKSNMAVPKKEPELIKLDNPKKKFKIFSTINYAGTPDLTKQGIHDYRTLDESDLSLGLTENGIYEPDSAKIVSFAKSMPGNAETPVYVRGSTWIKDRHSDNAAMNKRYEKFQRIFRRHNKLTPVSYFQVTPASLSELRTSNSNFFVNAGSWYMDAVAPTRSLGQYADILLPAAYIIDDDIISWKKEFYLTIKEAKQNSQGKPVYAHFYTDYFNQTANFPDANTPIKESTFRTMLESAYKMCDGVLLTSTGNATWNENSGFWKALTEFINIHKENIVLPETISDVLKDLVD